MLREADHVSRARCFGSMLCRFRRLGHDWTPRALWLPLPLERALMFVFLILAVAAGG